MNEHDETDFLQAPPKLVEALRNTQKERVFVPPQVDDSILKQAQERLSPAQRKIVQFPRWLAMAASFAVAAGLFAYLDRPQNTPTFAAGDINRDGAVDILDAFVLARRIEADSGGNNDFNQDGAVNQKDAESLAAEAVRLNRTGRIETSFFDTNFTNFHKLGNGIMECRQALLDDRHPLLSEIVFIREIRVSSLLINLEIDLQEQPKSVTISKDNPPLLAKRRKGWGRGVSSFGFQAALNSAKSPLPVPSPRLSEERVFCAPILGNRPSFPRLSQGDQSS